MCSEISNFACFLPPLKSSSISDELPQVQHHLCTYNSIAFEICFCFKRTVGGRCALDRTNNSVIITIIIIIMVKQNSLLIKIFFFSVLFVFRF